MRCKTPLCGHKAEFINTATKEYKCRFCRNRRFDRDSLSWSELKDENLFFDDDSPLEIPKAKPVNNYYCTQILDTGKWGIHTRDGEYFVAVLEKQEEAEIVTEALNNAFKNGAESVLFSLNSFSVDIRRKNGIVWSDGNNSHNNY
jgi:hypothetical protein